MITIYNTLVIYLVILALIAFFSFRRIKNHNDFFVAGRSGSVVMVTGSLLATILGGSAVIGAIDEAPRLQWAISWYMICAAIGLFAIVPFAGTINKLGRFSLPDLLDSMHGKLPKKISSFIIPFAWIGIIAVQIIASGKILNSFAGIPYSWGVVISGIVFIVYTLAGGQFSVLRTDLFQSILIIFGLFFMATFVFLSTRAQNISIPIGGSFFHKEFTPFDLIILILTYSTTFSTGPDIYTRLFSAHNKKTIRWSLLLSGIILIPVALSIGYLGVSGAQLAHETQEGSILVNLSKNILPHWGVAIMVLALLSAVLSSAATTLLSVSVIVSDQVLKGKFDGKTIPATRIIMLIFGLLSILLAWHFTSVIDLLLLALAIYAGAFTLPIFTGLFGLKFKTRWLSAAIISGGLIAFSGKIVYLSQKGLLGNLIIISSFLISILLLWFGKIRENK